MTPQQSLPPNVFPSLWCLIRYTNAAGLRDRLQQVQELTDAAAAKRSSGVQPMQPVRLKLGQRVTHADAGYRGLIFG